MNNDHINTQDAFDHRTHKEFARVLKSNGASTANKLCPKQGEFNLPFYSWYLCALKHYFDRLARTTRPDIANYAKYLAVNWFTFYQLRQKFSKLGMYSFDRLDIMDVDNTPFYQEIVIKLIKQCSVFRWLGNVASSGLLLLAINKP